MIVVKDLNSDSDEETVAGDLRWKCCDIFNLTLYNFDNENFGISPWQKYEYFLKYFEERMMTTIVNETN